MLVFYYGDKSQGSAAIENELKKASPSFEESINNFQATPEAMQSTPLRDSDANNITSKTQTRTQSIERVKKLPLAVPKQELSSSYLAR